ncbi:MAG TPA: SDR family oxidoreductase [Thermoanaerobaculia bacterium]|nr:SDR family oxidoreductase [Thermoanaerobaculia bacterium]
MITGASSGIGRAAALEFARRGANLFLGARRGELLDAVTRLCRDHGVQCTAVVADVTKREDCQRLIDTAGRIDVLVNNAGFAIFESIEKASPDDMEHMMETNYFGTVWCTQAALPGMLARGEGVIVNVSSIAGLMGYARMGGYCATKFAVVGFTEALRDEVIGRGVRISLICPGTVDTEFFVKAERGKMPGASRLIMAIKPERVARAICDSAQGGKYRRILPFSATLFMRLKEFAPRIAHAIFRRMSALVEKE